MLHGVVYTLCCLECLGFHRKPQLGGEQYQTVRADIQYAVGSNHIHYQAVPDHSPLNISALFPDAQASKSSLRVSVRRWQCVSIM